MLNDFTNEYKKFSREFRLEEPFDFLLFRPLAFLVVKMTWKLPLHPNHFSLAALFSALTSFIYLIKGTSEGFIIGGVGILAFSVFDCCDGMLARAKNKHSVYGEFIDMFVDLLSNIAFYSGLFIGLKKMAHSSPFIYLTWASAICILLHATFYHFYKEQYFFYFNDNVEGRVKKVSKINRDYQLLKKEKGQLFNKILLKSYLIFISAQKKNEKIKKYSKEYYTAYNINILPMWGMIAGSAHLFVLALSLIINSVSFYFFYSIFIANLWFIFIYILQTGINSTIEEVAS